MTIKDSDTIYILSTYTCHWKRKIRIHLCLAYIFSIVCLPISRTTAQFVRNILYEDSENHFTCFCVKRFIWTKIPPKLINSKIQNSRTHFKKYLQMLTCVITLKYVIFVRIFVNRGPCNLNGYTGSTYANTWYHNSPSLYDTKIKNMDCIQKFSWIYLKGKDHLGNWHTWENNVTTDHASNMVWRSGLHLTHKHNISKLLSFLQFWTYYTNLSFFMYAE